MAKKKTTKKKISKKSTTTKSKNRAIDKKRDALTKKKIEDLTATIVKKSLGQKEPTLISANESNALEDSNFNNDLTKKGSYSKIVIKPSIEELEKHKKFIKEEQKKNYF